MPVLLEAANAIPLLVTASRALALISIIVRAKGSSVAPDGSRCSPCGRRKQQRRAQLALDL